MIQKKKKTKKNKKQKKYTNKYIKHKKYGGTPKIERLNASRKNVSSILERIKKTQDASRVNMQKMFRYIKDESLPIYDLGQAKSGSPLYDLGQEHPSADLFDNIIKKLSDKSRLYNRENLVKLTPKNANQYIGYEILFKSRDKYIVKKIMGVSKSGKSIHIEEPDLQNSLEIVSRNVYVILKKSPVYDLRQAEPLYDLGQADEDPTGQTTMKLDITAGSWDFYTLKIVDSQPRTEKELCEIMKVKFPERITGKTPCNTLNKVLQILVKHGYISRIAFKTKGTQKREIYKYFKKDVLSKTDYIEIMPTEPETPVQAELFKTNSWEKLIEHFRETTGNTITISAMAGISNRLDGISFLKSVHGTSYYDDDLSDPNNIIYTLFGQEGDQNLNDRFNKPLLNRAKKIYFYSVNPKDKKNKYTWYGEYKINGPPSPKQHKDINGNMRIIYLINLIKI